VIERELKEKHANIDKASMSNGRNIAGLVLTYEFMPIVRDVLAFDLKCDEERIALFEKRFEERKSARLDNLTMNDIKDLQKKEVDRVIKAMQEERMT
jgi:hypothetical protein